MDGEASKEIMPRSTALLIGNAAYQSLTELPNPANDARDMARVLGACGFDTQICTDAAIADMDEAFEVFVDGIEEGDVALFFFAGHGVQIDGANYLMAVDTPSDRASAAKYQSLALDRVIEDMTRANGGTTLIVLDACRDNPWAGNPRGGARGLAPVYAPKGTLLAFSTSPGEQASDGVAGAANGAYTAALLQHIATPDLPVEQMLKRVRNTLAASTGGAQTSWEHTSLSGEFYFALGVTRRITEYGVTALKDSAFAPDPSIWSHGLIRDLKVYSWNTQNAAMNRFNLADAAATDEDDLFVLGRNILQAAEGHAHSAIDFIGDFAARTAGLAAPKQKALLDGVLFEIFFNPNGDIRPTPKARYFNEAFELQRFAALAPSFTFIADALAPFAARFHAAPPGRGLPAAVDVRILPAPEGAVDRILLGGNDLMRLEDEDYAGAARVYRARARETFENELARQLLVPRHNLTITYSPGAPPAAVRFPYGYTTSRAVE